MSQPISPSDQKWHDLLKVVASEKNKLLHPQSKSVMKVADVAKNFFAKNL